MAGMCLANGIVIAVAGVAWLLTTSAPELYYQLVQEDGSLEWATFWAFLLAAGMGYSAPYDSAGMIRRCPGAS